MVAPAVDIDRLDEVRGVVVAGLLRHNDRFLPPDRARRPFALSLRDDAGAVVGGLVGEMRMDWLYVDLLWVDEGLRGQGQGKALLDVAETEARKRGATHMHLSTWSFQAPEFYKANGFIEFGRIENHPAGHDNIYLVKRFS